MGQSRYGKVLPNANRFLHVRWADTFFSIYAFIWLRFSCLCSPISLRDPGQWDMRNLSTGTIAYLSHLPQARPTIHQIHKHIHKCKTSLNFSKRSYLPVWAFHLVQFLGQYPFLFYPIWAEGIFSRQPFAGIKEAIFGKILTSSRCILPAYLKMSCSLSLRIQCQLS